MKKPGMPDSKLIKRLQGGDIGAFDAFYKRYHQALYLNILKLTKDAAAAEDLLQEVFVVLWNKRMTLDPERSVGGWLFSVSFNLSVSHLRKKLRESMMKEEAGRLSAIPAIPGWPSPEGRLNEQQYLLLEKAVNRLSPQQQRVFTLCKLEGHSYDEAARKMNLSRHTVKEYLSLAMVSVKKYVHAYAESQGIATIALLCVLFTRW